MECTSNGSESNLEGGLVRGGRSDPFGNWLDFASAASLQRSLKECSATGPYDHLRIGRKLALKGLNRTDGEQVFASIAKVFQDTLWVKLLETHPEAPFQEGDAVRIQYWDVESAFYSDTTVSEISSLDNAYLAIVVPEETSELQRRTSPRVQTRLPITLSVVDAPQVSPSISQSISSHALDLGVGGMRFETDLPLEKGNQVRLMFSLPGLEEIQVDMRIATSNPVERAGERVNSVGATFVALELEDQIKILQFLIASRNDSKATEGQQGSGVEAIMASSAEAGPEVVSNAQPVVQSNEVPFPPASTASEKSVPETGDMPQNHEGHVPQVTAETATHVQENSQNTGVTDSHPDNHSQVVASS